MAIRKIRTLGDDVLRKKSKEVDEINNRVLVLIKDMIDTMYEAQGVGLAAPQVGVLKQVVVIDVGDGPLCLINPKILSTEGEVIDQEGCLSIPGKQADVARPEKVKVKALNESGQEVIIEGEGLLARALCHEIDHLYGVLYIDKAIEGTEEV